MKRVLLFIVAALLTFPAMAIGRGDGSTKANAIEFDWENGNVQEASANSKWYRVPLDTIYHQETPTLAIFLTNLTDNSANVHISGTLAGQTEQRDYTLAGKEHRVWTVAGGMLVQMKQTEVYLNVTAGQRIAISARVYETSDVDDACLQARDVSWTAGVSQSAGTEWYKIDLRAAKAATDKEVLVSIRNHGTQATVVSGGVSFDCPSTGLTERTTHIAAGGTYTKTISRSLLDALSADEVYVRLASSQAIDIQAQMVSISASSVIFDGTGATEAFLNTNYNVGVGEFIYKIKVASLRDAHKVPELTVVNTGASRANVKAEVAFVARPTSVITRAMSVGADASETRVLAANMLDGISAEYVYVRVSTDQPILFSGRLRNQHEGEACKTSIDFQWNSEQRQSANTTAWYAVDIHEAKTEQKDILLHLRNAGNKTATLRGSVAFECPYSNVQTVVRTLAAQTAIDKTIAWNLFGMMASDTIYIGVETDQNVVFSAELADMPTKEKDDACLQAIAFDWTYGHKQAAKDTVWYKVGLAQVRNTNLVPTLTIDNLGSGTAQIEGEMSLECPDSVANTVRTLAISAGGKYEKTVGRDFVNGIDRSIDTLYFRVISSQPIAFRVKMTKEDEGASCSSAVLFNWVSGNDQKAGDNLWYMVDLREAKAGNKDIRLSIRNKDNASAQVEAQVAFTCPCDVPQTQTTTLAALQTKTTTLAHSTLETVGDTVYVRLSSSQAVHVEAELVDPDPFTTIDCPDDAVVFEWGRRYTTTQDTTWYYVSKAVLDSLNKTTKTPRIYLQSAGRQTVTAEIAYHCPITEAMQSKSVSMAAGQERYKLVERSTAEQLAAKHDTIMVRLVGNGLQFQVDLVDPNTGEDCLHAINYAIGDTTIQDESIVRWYRLDKNAVVALDKQIIFGIENLGSRSGSVQAGLYTSCDSAAIMQEVFNLAAGQKHEKEVSSDVFSAFSTDYLYLKLTSAAGQQIRLTSRVRDYAPITPITACEEATDALINTTYTVNAGESRWYVVDIHNLQYNTKGNGKLTVRNLDGTPATAKAEISWVCPVEHEMTARTRVIAGNDSLVYTVERSQFNAFDSARVYVRVSTDRNISFRFEIEMSKGDDCLNAIDFDWENGNIHPGSDADGKTNCLWYQVQLDSTRIPAGYDMRLYIVNLDKQHATETSARIMWECNDEVKSLERTLAAGDTISQNIDRDVIAQAGWPNLQILYCSDKTTKIYAGLEPESERVQGFDTIRSTMCDGSEYKDSIFVGDKWHYINMFIDSSDPASCKLDSTISWRDGTTMRDSVITYEITPLVAATALDATQLETIGAMPLLVEGMSLYVDSSLVALRRYYDAIDTVAKTDTIYWSEDNRGRAWADTTTIIARNTHTKQLYLHIEDSCGNAQDFPYTFMAEPWRSDSVALYDTVCPNSAAAAGPTTLFYKKEVTIADTLGRMRTIDSVFVYHTVVRVQPTLYTELPQQPVVACGKAINTNRATISLMGQFTADKEELTVAVDSIVWQCKDTLSGSYADLTTDRLGKDEQQVVLRYVALTECGDSLFSQDFVFTPEAYIYKVADEVSAEVCAGSEYVSRLGTHIIQNDTTWNDSLTIHDTDMDYDSVYVYNIHTLRLLRDTVEHDTICGGDVYAWRNGLQLTESGIYYDTVRYEQGCDKELYTLYLTVQTATDMPEESATIKQGQTYTWHTWRDQVLSEAGTYYDTARYATGCDSVRYTLVLTVAEPMKFDTTIVDTVCAGTEYFGREGAHIIYADTAWTDSVRVVDAVAGDVDSLYHYQLSVYHFAMPAISVNDVLAVCGQAVDTAKATAAIEEAVAADELFAPNTMVRWYMQQGSAWVALTSDALDGQTAEVTLKCEISSDCATQDTTLVCTVEQPNADNDTTLRNLPAKSMYNNRLLMINLNKIREQLPDWTITEADVHWYKMTGNTPDAEADTEVGTGYYYTTPEAEELTGSYYATIAHTAVAESDCGAEARTVILICADTQSLAPELRPSIAQPEEEIHIINLNPEVETEIVVYSSTGQKVATYHSQEAEMFVMKAAQNTGYYMVDVHTADDKITLRYVVK